MKPLVRWIIGPVKNKGFDCLKESIKAFAKIYTNANLMICHNQLDGQIEELEEIGVPLYKQTYDDCVRFAPHGVAWKLYPARLRPDGHEIIIDNDIIIKDKIPQIDEFFSSDSTLVYEASKPMYGQLDKFVPKTPCVNSGIYGMPPGFDFDRKMNFYIDQIKDWENNCNQGRYTWDEQGMVAACMLNHPSRLLITLDQVTNCELDLDDSKLGMHFVGLNRYKKHKPWKEWRMKHWKAFL